MFDTAKKDIRWPYFASKLTEVMDRQSVMCYQIEQATGLKCSNLYPIKKGEKRATDATLKKIAGFLNTSFEEMKGWRAVDEYGDSLAEIAMNMPIEELEALIKSEKKRRGLK